ncbi:NAD-glutamate dehydrogenase [Chromobacterium haemolyticum]|uniref:NAD-glutamate dehydrogenase n=1 Tax=Chromobacterium haemolyticum TaxID=394935 RepID=UPI001316C0D5|nr:NAD-glutamate dehydrogenase [Chromobacterium haemolyticum]BBH12892.1 hypothetical protein CH06BL_21400 [Chromobacterium haemolyticum]
MTEWAKTDDDTENFMIEPAAALAQWGKWAVDHGSLRSTCFSIEGRYARDPARYRHEEDAETARRHAEVRYSPLVAELVERLVNRMPANEKLALRARHVQYRHLADEDIARRVAMSAHAFDGLLLQATVRFGRAWREQSRKAA